MLLKTDAVSLQSPSSLDICIYVYIYTYIWMYIHMA